MLDNKNQKNIGNQKNKTIVFIDYANIKAWARDKDLNIDMEILIEMLNSVGIKETRFYYGRDERNLKIDSFFFKMEKLGYIVITKSVQYFKIALSDLLEKEANIRWLNSINQPVREGLKTEAKLLDKKGIELFAPKANFDVEISVDALMMKDTYENLVLFSGDGDFAYLIKALKQISKKIIIVSGRKSLSGYLFKEADKFVTMERIASIIPEILLSRNQGRKNDKNAKPAFRQVLKKCAPSIASLLGLSSGNVDNK